jgi:hypothetical protein
MKKLILFIAVILSTHTLFGTGTESRLFYIESISSAYDLEGAFTQGIFSYKNGRRLDMMLFDNDKNVVYKGIYTTITRVPNGYAYSYEDGQDITPQMILETQDADNVNIEEEIYEGLVSKVDLRKVVLGNIDRFEVLLVQYVDGEAELIAAIIFNSKKTHIKFTLMKEKLTWN